MKVGIIGAGFTGLAAGYRLASREVEIVIFEKETGPGGLAIGFKDKKWKWALEKHYHHLFTSDWAIRNLAQEINHPILFKRPTTSSLVGDKIYQLDSALSLLKFDRLTLLDRVRTGTILAYFKLTPFWKNLEKVTAVKFLKKTMGESSWKIIWEPLFSAKFGKNKNKISAAWFWARIRKRSPKLGYPVGGFERLAKRLSGKILKLGGEIYYETVVSKIYRKNRKICVEANGKTLEFDKVICTLPTPFFLKVTKGISPSYVRKLKRFRGLGAVNMVLALKDKFLKNGTYWLSIHNSSFPFLAIVEHTNFMEPRRYGHDRLVYIGNYLEPNHKYFRKSERELLEEFLPFLKKVNPFFKKSLIRKVWLFKTPFAQPIIPLNYSKKMPKTQTSIPNLYLVNIQQVYPWDRGTNYAVELGEKVAQKILAH